MEQYTIQPNTISIVSSRRRHCRDGIWKFWCDIQVTCVLNSQNIDLRAPEGLRHWKYFVLIRKKNTVMFLRYLFMSLVSLRPRGPVVVKIFSHLSKNFKHPIHDSRGQTTYPSKYLINIGNHCSHIVHNNEMMQDASYLVVNEYSARRILVGIFSYYCSRALRSSCSGVDCQGERERICIAS